MQSHFMSYVLLRVAASSICHRSKPWKPENSNEFLLDLLVAPDVLVDRHSIQVSGSIRPQNAQAERTLTSRKLLYELLSIVVHHGGPHSGHYTVYRKVRLPKSRDSKVKSAEEDCAGLLCHTEVREHSEKVEIDATVTSRVLEQLQDGRERLREATEEGNARDEEIVLWFKVSDSNVRRVEELEVLLANASLLFYERLTNS